MISHNDNNYYYLHAQGQTLGPLSQSAIIDELESERLGQDAYLWNAQQESWQSLKDCPDFKNWTVYLPNKTLIENIQVGVENEMGFSDGENYFLSNHHFLDSSQYPPRNEPAPLAEAVPAEPLYKRKAVLVSAAVVTASLLAVVAIALTPEKQKLSPLLQQSTLSARQIQDLEEQIHDNKLTTPRVLQGTDINSAGSLFIVTPYPNGSRLKIALTGKRGTLVGALNQEIETRATTYQFVAQTAPLKTAAGLPLPEGSYTAHIHCLNCAERSPSVTSVRIGTLTNQQYSQSLNEFHKIVRAQAESELVELKEILHLLTEIGPGSTPKRMKRFAAQLEEIFSSLDPASIKNLYVYYPIYLKIKMLYSQKHTMTVQPWKLEISQIENLRAAHEKDLKGAGLNFDKIDKM